MATKKPFPQADFLEHLERMGEHVPFVADARLPPALIPLLAVSGGTGEPTKAAACLIQLLKAQAAALQASFDTELAADELRRYQKFARPGQPSSHIVQLRQRQAAARQATSQSKQSLIKAAVAFVREAGIEVPPNVGIEAFIAGWVDANVPKVFPLPSYGDVV
jgi:hypothetical protein